MIFGKLSMKNTLWILFVVILAACSTGSNRLSDIDIEDEEDIALEDDVEMPTVMHQEVRNEYSAILKDVEDKELKKEIQRRIAGVEMLEGDYHQLKGTKRPTKGFYARAIKSYKKFLKDYPNASDNHEVLYQLAKAYDLDGQSKNALKVLNNLVNQYPQSPRINEAQFRLAEIYFNNGKYHKAEIAYRKIIQDGRSVYVNNAYYMRGWALYKQSLYEESIQDFSKALDRLLPKDGDLSSLGKLDKALVEDTLHVMSLAFSHAGGASKITELYAKRKEDKYTWLIYDKLGMLFLEKERFEDSAATYREYVRVYPTSDKGPELYAKVIKAYVEGNFFKQVLPEKESYVNNYGIYSKYWANNAPGARERVIPSLKPYIKELAQHYHSEGQLYKRDVVNLGPNPKSKKSKKLNKEKNASFASAAHYYKEYMATFPKDPSIPEMVFLQAEAYFDAGQFALAISGYEKTAYEYKDPKKGADAGYASIIAYLEQLRILENKRGVKADEIKAWRERTVDNQLRFAKVYKRDKRSSAVLTKAAEELFKLKEYEKALKAGQSILAQKGKIDTKLHKAAYGVIALSYAELGDFKKSEQNYTQQLKYVGKKSTEYKNIKESIAIVIYKQGEQALAKDDKALAVKEFLRIKKVAPHSAVRVSAQYDAATYLLQLNKSTAAIAEFQQLKNLFKKHKLAPEFARKLAFALSQDKQYRRAANEYMALHWNDKDEPVRRDALFLAAENFEKAGEIDKAIKHFKRWAKSYEQPFETRMEARYHLAYLYKKQKDMNRHLFWLRRVIAGDKNAGSDRTDRSMWLGAWANAEYGHYWVWEFDRVKIKQPLNISLAKKNEKLKNATDRYEKAADYGILEFVTLSSFKIAGLYAGFSQSLMDSPRPRGLSQLEMEQYELLLEDEAIPFEDLAIELYQGNVSRTWEKHEYNEWIEKSFSALAVFMPARFGKIEKTASYGNGIR